MRAMNQRGSNHNLLFSLIIIGLRVEIIAIRYENNMHPQDVNKYILSLKSQQT